MRGVSDAGEVTCDWCVTVVPRRETRSWNGTRFCRDEVACDTRAWLVQPDARVWVWQLLADAVAAATGASLETDDPEAVEVRVTVGNQVDTRERWWGGCEPTSAAQLLADLRDRLSREMGLTGRHLDAAASHVTVVDVRVGSALIEAGQ